MMRKMFIGAIGAVALLAMGVGTAQAITFKLEFQSSGGACTPGSATCTADIGDTVLIDVIIVMNIDRLANSTSVGFDLSAMGLNDTDVTATSFQFGTTTPTTLNGDTTPVGDTVAVINDLLDTACNTKLPGCDHRYTSFGFTNAISTGAGQAYTAGTITMDLNNVLAGTWTIAAYQRTGVDAPGGTANLRFDAILTIPAIPEPGTASLLGLGLMGLVMAGRRARR